MLSAYLLISIVVSFIYLKENEKKFEGKEALAFFTIFLFWPLLFMLFLVKVAVKVVFLAFKLMVEIVLPTH